MLTLKDISYAFATTDYPLCVSTEAGVILPANTQPQIWRCLIPQSFRCMVGLPGDKSVGTFTGLFNGKSDRGHGVDRKRDSILDRIAASGFGELVEQQRVASKLSIEYSLQQAQPKKQRVLSGSDVDASSSESLKGSGRQKALFDSYANAMRILIFPKMGTDDFSQMFVKDAEAFLQLNLLAEAQALIVSVAIASGSELERKRRFFDALPKTYESQFGMPHDEHNVYQRTCQNSFTERLPEDIIHYLDNRTKRCLDSLERSEVRWGSCLWDEELRVTNCCESLLAFFISDKGESHLDVLEDALSYVEAAKTGQGIRSEFLGREYTTSTAMYLWYSSIAGRGDEEEALASKFWIARTKHGWGPYAAGGESVAMNIGCTYWALRSLAYYPGVAGTETRYALIERLLAMSDSGRFSSSASRSDEARMYATSMMFVLYCNLPPGRRAKIESRYDWKSALKFISENFDQPGYDMELEWIDAYGGTRGNKIDGFSCTHASIGFAFEAMGLAMSLGLIESKAWPSLLNRVIAVCELHFLTIDGNLYWQASRIPFLMKSRGIHTSPTAQIVLGMNALSSLIKKLD